MYVLVESPFLIALETALGNKDALYKDLPPHAWSLVILVLGAKSATEGVKPL